jgi:aspartate 1-decarboxylase
MFRQMLRSKIHRATVTESCLEYEGSLTVDEDLLEAAGILPFEAIVISNLNNGERFMTYAMAGKRGSGEIVLNGPTARKGAVGDQIIIFCYEYYGEEEIKRHVPRIIRVDGKNRITAQESSKLTRQKASK